MDKTYPQAPAILKPSRGCYLWEDALARLVADAALRARLASALGATVERDWSLDRHAPRWLAAWARLRTDVLARRGGSTTGRGA